MTNSIINVFYNLSNAGKILIIVSVILLIVIIYNSFIIKNNYIEGFEQKESFTLKEGDYVYDDFYVTIYDQLVYNQIKNNYEIGEIVNATKPTSESIILDIGSGTGHHVALMEAQGIKARGVDVSNAMVKKAKENYPQFDFVQGDVRNALLFMPDSYTHIFCLYFSIYYFKDKNIFFNNCMKWLMPGGSLVVHIVDRDMFDPILPPANPLFLVSPQRYAKKRITESKVVFNNMEYSASFDLEPNSDTAEFNEKFKEKSSNKIRKNKHKFYMEADKQIIAMAQNAGFIVQGKIDLLKIGYEYQYLYIFVKPN